MKLDSFSIVPLAIRIFHMMYLKDLYNALLSKKEG